jgi:hypothetical protein
VYTEKHGERRIHDEAGRLASVCPLEVKAEGNVRSQSLKSYERRFRPKTAYRVSMLPYKEQDVPLENGEFCRLVNIPLYAVSNGVAAPFPRHDIQSEQSEVILDDLFSE